MKNFRYLLGLVVYIFIFLLLFGASTWGSLSDSELIRKGSELFSTIVLYGGYLIPYWLLAVPMTRERRWPVLIGTAAVMLVMYAGFFLVALGHWMFAVVNTPLFFGIHYVLFLMSYLLKMALSRKKS